MSGNYFMYRAPQPAKRRGIFTLNNRGQALAGAFIIALLCVITYLVVMNLPA